MAPASDIEVPIAPSRSAELSTFDDFMDHLREPGLSPMLSPKKFSEMLQLDVQTLARNARVHRTTVTRAPASDALQLYLKNAVRVIKAASDLSKNVNKTLFWYRNHPLQPFGYITADELVANGKTDALLRYISMLDAGAAG